MDFAAKATCLGGAWGGPIARAHEPPRRTVGFTLIELMVVLVLVMLISAIALPSVARIFDSGADAMAYNLISAQLESARMYALENGTPAGIHVQLADPAENPDLEGVQYVTVIARSNAPQEVDSGTASSGAASTLTDLTKTWEVNDQTDHLVQITGGLGSGQTRTIQSNTADT
ncbi:MAG: hypothetical protein ISS78_04280, partial [Phycisphaerae bacterium]|nr:hypothetical protein [Phycisphaerae bacterium]